MKGSPTKQKYIIMRKLNKAYLGTAKVNKAGGGTLNSPLPQNVTPCPHYIYRVTSIN